jgi:predicted nucleotide-binding protein with TIR-like domain
MAKLLVRREQVEGVLAERIKAGEDLAAKADVAERAAGWGDWLALFSAWREHTFAELHALYEEEDISVEFGAVTTTADYSAPVYAFPHKKRALDGGLRKLRSLVERLELAIPAEDLKPHPGVVGPVAPEPTAQAANPNIFIVHGKEAGGFREEAAQFINDQPGLSAIILAEQANEGRTIIEKFEAKALGVGYAVVLLTPEDTAYGHIEEAPARPNRARQNVILELGYFMGSLGRPRVAALIQEGVEVPSDIHGILYIPLDEGGAWKTLLARELRAAGYEVNL